MFTRQSFTRPLTQISLALATMSMLSGCIVVASPTSADFHQQKELSLSASSLKKLDIEAGAGSLIVKGSEQATEISVTADIYTRSSSSDSYQFELSGSGSTAFLVAKNNHTSSWGGKSPRIDLVVTIPARMMLEINDGSGGMDISDIIGSVDIDDGSGEIKLNDIVGNVRIKDGSGKITLTEIDGNLSIDDGSGSIYARGISGNANIEDGSGDLTVRNVKGTIIIDDGSGDITIEDAGGLKIIDSGSGGLKVNNVKGGFEIDS
jgi:DUF4097 and DUF4098 domain-containing protein YvlB